MLILRHLASALVVAASLSNALAADPAAEANKKLGRGVNLGNALEAPNEGEWGITLQPEYFEAIKKAGFRTVRLPIKWSAHAAQEAPFAVDPKFFERIDWAVDQATKHGLNIILNVHHFDELDKDPAAAKERFLALWTQIAGRYRDRPDSVYFELDNEPHDKLTDDAWNALIPDALKAVRAGNPRRTVIVGPGMWNNVNNLAKLKLPDDDRHLIVTFHYYLPFQFTHQGAEWAKGSEAWLGKTWTATPEQTAELARDFDKAAAWSKEQNRPIFLGEFGAYSKADLDSRVAWTAAVAREAETRGFSWAYWEFAAGFGIYDPVAKEWRKPLLGALIPDSPEAASK